MTSQQTSALPRTQQVTTAAASNPLLVPIAVEALVVNQAVQKSVAFRRWQNDYNQLNDFHSPIPVPFSDVLAAAPDSGVHLHWSLPRAITRGVQVQAKALADVADGAVTALTVLNPGYGYAGPPTLTISGGGGSGAIASAVMVDGTVASVTVNQPGSGYTCAPTVTIAPSTAMSFPFAPNRWLVVRYGAAASSTQPRATKSWLLQSDALAATGDPYQTNPFINPSPDTPGKIEPVFLGTAPVVLAAWEGEAGSPQKLFLRAVGPGSATFAAFQPGVVNVFSFFDPLLGDVNGSWANPNAQPESMPENTALTYLVVGWYSDPTHDPVYGPISGWDAQGDPVRSPLDGTADPAAAFQDLLKGNNWSVTDAPAGVPSQTLCHGLVYDVTWQTTSVPPRPNSPVDSMMKGMTIAIGNTAIDALSALIDNIEGSEVDGDRLAAFQYDVLAALDLPDGPAQLELTANRAAFTAVPGGTVWRIVPAPAPGAPGATLEPGSLPSSPLLTPVDAAALAKLNADQRQQDSDLRLLKSLQWELYATWWKGKRLGAMTPAQQAALDENYLPGNVTVAGLLQLIGGALDQDAASTGLLQQVVALHAKVMAQAQGLPGPTDIQAILAFATQQLGLDPAVWQLKPSALPPFFQPADPVILVAGIATSDKQGGLTETTLACRYVGQTVTGVDVVSAGCSTPVTATTGGMGALMPSPPANPYLPAAVTAGLSALHVEAVFVDATNAASIVAGGLGSTDPSAVSALNAAMVAGTAQISTLSAPLAAATAFAQWTQQPWSPLYLEWKVDFYPSVGAAPSGNDPDWPPAPVTTVEPDAAASAWFFNQRDFDWCGALPTTYQTYVGRTFLTPQSTHVFIAKLKKYLAEHPDPDLEAVQRLIEQVGEWNFLSQRLSGLNEQLVMRDLTSGQAPDATVAAQVGEQYRAVPDVSLGEVDYSFPPPDPFFFPVRGGFFTFDSLQIVDSFGQTVNLLLAENNLGQGVPFSPVRSQGLAPSENPGLAQPAQLVQFAPRLVQTARLNFHFVSAQDDTHDTDMYPGESPVCGWVLANHLNSALSVYDADGNALGELMVLSGFGVEPRVEWMAAPASMSAVTDPSTIADTHLSKFVCALIARTDGGVSFANLLQAIDETLWSFDPLGARADQNMSILVGRPLALVRAALQLELDGTPLYDQSWGMTLMQACGGVDAMPFPVKLGSLELYDDGLIGYFEDDTYTAFNCLHQPDGFQPANGAYLQPIGVNGNYLQLAFDYPAYTVKHASLLLDPRGAIHAFTGILPTFVMSLPVAWIDGALARIALSFRTGPLLTGADAVQIPRPSERNGTWSWVQRCTALPPNWTAKDWIASDAWQTMPVSSAETQARLPAPPARIIEGWLRLTPTDIDPKN